MEGFLIDPFFLVFLVLDTIEESVSSSVILLAAERLLLAVDLTESSSEVSTGFLLVDLDEDLTDSSLSEISVFLVPLTGLLIDESVDIVSSSSDTEGVFLAFVLVPLAGTFFLVFLGLDFRVESVEGKSSSPAIFFARLIFLVTDVTGDLVAVSPDTFLLRLVLLVTEITDESVDGISSSSSDEAAFLLTLGDFTDELVDSSSSESIDDAFPLVLLPVFFTGDGDFLAILLTGLAASFF